MEHYPELTPTDRADIVCRVFEQKGKDFIKFLREVRTFGYVCAVLYTIEFQKRGLPHCHTLLWVDSKGELQDAQHIAEFISAEIHDPVEDPRGYKLVTDLMMHGPCGNANLGAPCTQGGTCNKHFPKKYNDMTFFNSSGHTQYRRRDTGIYVMKGESRLNSCNVVPYNRTLYLAFEAHINVEYYGWSMLIKYLYKYISKGSYRILAKIKNSEVSTSVHGNNKQINEIQNYVDGRFICPFKACWRIFDFPTHSREPVVQILNVHLENMQHVKFCERDRLDVIANLPEKKKQPLPNAMRDDIPAKISKTTGIPNYHVNTAELQGYILYELEEMQNGFGKFVTDFGMQLPSKHLLKDLENKLLMEEKNYNQAFAKWLLDVGNDEIGEPDEEDDQNSSSIAILPNYLTPTAGALQEKAIVFPKNKTADVVNAKILSDIEGQSRTYLSNDMAIPMGKET
ncbi:DNA helicase, partial [Tanacetum coccineum]